MAFTKEQIKRFAELSRLHATDAELEKWQPDLNNIMEWIDHLDEVNVDGVEPMLTACEYELPMREDVVKMENTREDVLKNAPDQDGEAYLVPKVVK